MKPRIFFQLWMTRLFIIFTKTARHPPPPPAESIGCPQNKPGNKRTKLWNGWWQNNGDKLWTKYVIFLAFFFLLIFYFLLWQLQMFSSQWFWNVHTNNNLHSLYMRYVSSYEDFKFWDFLVSCHSLLPISMFLSSFSNKLIKSEWNSLQLIIFKIKHTWNNFFARNARNLTSFKTRMIHVLTCLRWWWNFMIGNHRNSASES